MSAERYQENKKGRSKDKKHSKESGGGTLSHRVSHFMGTLRPSHGKVRGPFLQPTTSDNTASHSSKFNNSNVSNDSSSTFYEASDLSHIPTASTANGDDYDLLSDNDVKERFKSVMDDLFEGNERKNQLFEKITPAQMRQMLRSHNMVANNEMRGENSPENLIQCLNDITSDNIYSKNSKVIFDRVAIALKTYGLKWSRVFGENLNGPNAMLKAMHACIDKVQHTIEKVIRDGSERREKQTLLYEILGAGIEAFKSYLNLGLNFNSLKESLAKDISEVTIHVLNILYYEVDERSIKTKHSCAILLFTLAMPNENNPSNGQNIVQLLLQSVKKWQPGRERFDCFIHELDGAIDVASSFLMCINAIFMTLSTEQRYHLRSELFRAGFKSRFEILEKSVAECEEPKQKENLSTQIDLFLRHIEIDCQAMHIKLEKAATQWGDPQACFDYLYTLVKGTPAEAVLTSIINRMICIRDDPHIRLSYLRLIDECITRIVFSKNAADPDFDTCSMDSESIGDSGLGLNDHTPSMRHGSLHDLSQMNGNVVNTENEVQINMMKGRVEHLEQTREKLTKALETILTKVDTDTANSLKKQYSEIFGESSATTEAPSNVPPPPPLPPSLSNIPPPPPMPPSLGNVPPPPLLPGNLMPPPPPPPPTGNIPPPPPPMPGLIPPPPPMMTEGGMPPPPPPPPFPGMSGSGGPPPPPLPGMPGIGGPPPPPGMPGSGGLPFGPPPLPAYLPTKQKYVVGEPVKKVAWSKINPHTIKKESIWTDLDEHNFQNKAFFASIRENFATKMTTVKPPADSDTESAPSASTKKTKDFRVLDPRAGQNYAIMFSQLKSNPQQFRQWLLACDGEHLTGDLLAQLDKSLPTPDELKKLSELKEEFNDLPDVEQYFCAISDIKRIQQRIRILLFKSQYKELLEETEKNLVAARQACETVRRSKRFPKLIELVLTIGNYMNSSSKAYEPIHGFDISFLPKLHSTKANDGKRTLLHFLLQEIEKDHSDLLKFGDEFQGVAEVASKIDTNELQKTLNEIKGRVNSSQTELDNAKNATTQISSEDHFAQAIEGFVAAARDDVERLESLHVKMQNVYQDLCEYLTIDSKKCPLNEFFTDLKSFCTVFLTCLQENRLWREQDEKNKRTQMSKQLVDDLRKRQRAESKIEPKPFFKPSDEDTDVVSNLMSVLKDANMSAQRRPGRRPQGRYKVNDLRMKVLDRENAQLLSEHNITPHLLASSILKDRNYV